MFTPLESLSDRVIDQLPDRNIIFIHTPLCGTCKVARRMLEIVYEMTPNAAIYEVNANFVPDTLQEWRIQSVPALLYMDKPKDTIDVQYAISDVPALLRRVQAFFK
ncbi:thioredoxin family protein [Alicyclobacillus acidiphilus]|uniref:thioredoxin family protein n=1 Tax=Alicyclobacillus acidiphilus TaxID=182455 RepID=UPI0008376FF8|nr:thioredoxin family protein [Alicyclobacillus acidiphilus]